MRGSRPPSEAAEVYRPAPPLLWCVPDALVRSQRLLPALLGPVATRSASLWCFLPAAEDLERPDRVLNRTVIGRSAVASTFVVGLEIARQSHLALAQDEAFETIRARSVRGGDGAAAACVQRR